MKFTKYRSIENSYRAKYLDLLHLHGLSAGMWVVEEKVHGANFSVWIENGEVRLAKRSSFIAEDGTGFYRADKLLPNLTACAQKLAALLPDVQGPIAVYGEIFGGRYDHPEVAKCNDVSAVQKGVDYSPDIHFIAYDLFYNDEFAPVNERQELLERAGFMSMPVLTVGTFEECMKYPNEFRTIIPDLLGLPPIEGNTCEGIVLKPMEAKYLPDGSRVILKNKNTKFTEKEQRDAPEVKTPEPLTPEQEEMYRNFTQFINANRVAAVCSKIGEVSIKDFKRVLNDMRTDVFEEFNKDYADDFAGLEKSDRQRLTKLFNSVLAQSVKDHLMAVERGEA